MSVHGCEQTSVCGAFVVGKLGTAYVSRSILVNSLACGWTIEVWNTAEGVMLFGLTAQNNRRCSATGDLKQTLAEGITQAEIQRVRHPWKRIQSTPVRRLHREQTVGHQRAT